MKDGGTIMERSAQDEQRRELVKMVAQQIEVDPFFFEGVVSNMFISAQRANVKAPYVLTDFAQVAIEALRDLKRLEDLTSYLNERAPAVGMEPCEIKWIFDAVQSHLTDHAA